MSPCAFGRFPRHVAALACGFLLLSASYVRAADLVEVANIVRTRHCGEQSLPDRPLRAHAQLDAAAERIADGSESAEAIIAAGYRAKSSASIRVKTPGGRDDVAARELSEHFCHLLADPAFSDIGVYRRGPEIWMVLADGGSLPAADDDALPDAVLRAINAARAEGRQCGDQSFDAAEPLRRSVVLDRLARAHADDMAAQGFLAHTGSDGSDPAARATRAGYGWRKIAENVAAGQTTAADVLDTWLDSPGHCANLMDPAYRETGVAFALMPGDGRDIYWVQVFADPE